MALSKQNFTGLVLALVSSAFIGASFIIKKQGLRRAAAISGVRAGVGGYSYLLEPLWWVGMITMIVGEIANFVAYAFAPAVLVTPLGALSIIVSAVLAQIILKEKLHPIGVLGCIMCIAGSIIIVIHAPREQPIKSVLEIWSMATQPAFLVYVGSVVVLVFILVFHFAPRCGHTNVLVYTGICSLMGSLSVMSVKALGTSLKLTFEGKNQLIYPQTWFFMLVVAFCVIMQMNYLNKALDTFNTAVVSPIYYVMFTTLTILASVIMFKLRNEVNKLEERLGVTDDHLKQKNLKIKKLTDEKKCALATQYATEAALRRVHANQKDDDILPNDSIITPFEAEIKIYKNELQIM